MLWSFSRDGGVPLYRVWASLNPRTQTPNNAVWAMTALAFLLGLPMIWSNVAFQAIGSVSSIALWLSCEPPATNFVARVALQYSSAGCSLRSTMYLGWNPSALEKHSWVAEVRPGFAELITCKDVLLRVS